MSLYSSECDTTNLPCFLGYGQVLMDDGSRKRVDELRKGDRVHEGHRVICSIKTYVRGGRTEIVHLGNSESGGWTPNHPVRFGETWYLPGDMAAEKVEFCGSVYNFVLESGHTLTIGNVETCTIGHAFEGPVIEHMYFGKRLEGVPHILDVIETSPGYSEGYVVWSDLTVERDEYGYVCKLKPEYCY